MQKKILILLIALFCFSFAQAQNNSTVVATAASKNYIPYVVASEAVLYTASMIGLYTLWYKDYPTSAFHLFNDSKEWLQMDKVCHATAAYSVGRFGYNTLKLSRMKEQNAVWYGGTLGLLFLTSVEVFDGFSKEWGFSASDIFANIAGSGLFISQQLYWKEQRIMLKYSFHTTNYAAYRPNILGKNYLEQSVKDYNGITIWLSSNIHSFLPENNILPKWLNIAIGYGAEEMLGGFGNPELDNLGNPMPYYNRYRQLFLSLDLDFSKLPIQNKFLRVVLETLNFIKIPFPTLEFNSKNGIKGHWLYF